MLKHVSIYLVPGLAVLNFFAGLPTLFQKSVWIFLIISMTSWIIFSGKHDFLDHSLIFSFFNFIIFLVSRAPDIPKSPSSDWAAAPQGVSHRLLIRHQLRQDSADWLQLIYFSSKFLIQIILIRTTIKLNCTNHSWTKHIIFQPATTPLQSISSISYVIISVVECVRFATWKDCPGVAKVWGWQRVHRHWRRYSSHSCSLRKLLN